MDQFVCIAFQFSILKRYSNMYELILLTYQYKTGVRMFNNAQNQVIPIDSNYIG